MTSSDTSAADAAGAVAGAASAGAGASVGADAAIGDPAAATSGALRPLTRGVFGPSRARGSALLNAHFPAPGARNVTCAWVLLCTPPFPMAEASASSSSSSGAVPGTEALPPLMPIPVDSQREQDRLLPEANIVRIMKRALPDGTKISKEAKAAVVEAASEFVAFVTQEGEVSGPAEAPFAVHVSSAREPRAGLGFIRPQRTTGAGWTAARRLRPRICWPRFARSGWTSTTTCSGTT